VQLIELIHKILHLIHRIEHVVLFEQGKNLILWVKDPSMVLALLVKEAFMHETITTSSLEARGLLWQWRV
jgi:hypothetical protein